MSVDAFLASKLKLSETDGMGASRLERTAMVLAGSTSDQFNSSDCKSGQTDL
jgi:hypothetical protein